MLNNDIDKSKIIRIAITISGIAVLVIVFGFIISAFAGQKEDKKSVTEKKPLPELNLEVKLLKVNKYSRPAIPLKKVNSVVVHYTANPGTDAVENRNYFNNLPKTNKKRKNPIYASSHFIIGLEGQIVQCIPLAEIAYASNDRNSDTVAIECCHPKKNGKFNEATYKALIEVLAYLCIRYDLDPEKDIIRHYDVTGKLCPLYYVKNPDLWDKIKLDVKKRLN